MKKIIGLSILILMFMFSGHGQQQTTGEIQATANLIGSVSVNKVNDLNFGDITDFEQTKTINTNQDNVGVFVIEQTSGNPNVEIFFTFPDNLELKNGDGSQEQILPINNWVYALNQENTTEETGTPINDNEVVSLKMNDYNNREAYVFLGATITPDVDKWGGEYEGDIVLTIEHN